MMRDMMKWQFESGHEVVRLPLAEATASDGVEIAADTRVHEEPSQYTEKAPVFDDPIVAEVRQVRKEILESFGGDYKAMLRDARRRQEERKKKLSDDAEE
ncbi:MAG: hypothetical protein L3K26_05475 [Candidatus Hydrogenedentes bacterium]|nr:hypothetical protein [Candidatus Hydrogenedentota bacterium]